LFLSGCVLKRREGPQLFKNPKPNNSENKFSFDLQKALVRGGSNMTGIDLCVNKPHCAAAVRP